MPQPRSNPDAFLLPQANTALNDTAGSPRQFILHGVDPQGRKFRPSDWAERLCGVMACYRPGGMASGRDAYIGYSPYVRPVTLGGVKCVVLDERLREIERRAFDFVMNFGRDNDLVITEACFLPDPLPDSRPASPAD